MLLIDPDAEFEWDESKRVKNFRKHDIDFADAVEIFKTGFVDQFSAHGGLEERWLATGKIKSGGALTVIYTWRRGVRRVISARPARQGERAMFAAAAGESSATPPPKLIG